MDGIEVGRNESKLLMRRLVACFVLVVPVSILAGTKPPVVPKWERFDHIFKSTQTYSNPVQQATLSVQFTSPLGEIDQVFGFWDGGRTWRVRFSPDQPGRWTYRSTCSDYSNKGLDGQTGEFVCTAVIGTNRFSKHGRVRVARNHRHFEHQDGTPFFWLADSVWDGARLADSKSWFTYATVRAAQQFSVAQWSVSPGRDERKQSAFSGPPDRIKINPDFFKRLDVKLETLRRSGILNAITPMLELEPGKTESLTDDQAALLVQYVVARWGADPVAWVIAFEGDAQSKRSVRWKKIGQTVFAQRNHAPVLLFPGETQWLLNQFRQETWVDAFGFQTTTVAGALTQEWSKTPERPLTAFLPVENSLGAQSKNRIGADDVRHAAYGGLFMAPTAGVSYGANGVANWDTTAIQQESKTLGSDWPAWRKSLLLPGAKQMSTLAGFIDSIDFWKLRPRPDLIANQPGGTAPERFIAAVASETKDLALVYVPKDRTIDILNDALPSAPSIAWINPRTGERSPAVAVVGDRSCQFPTPDPGDWLLLMKSAKQ